MLRKQDYCSLCQEHGICRGYFGFCPVCHKKDGYLNIGQSHWFYCKEHKKRWREGSNLFDSWRDETEQEQHRRYDEIGFDSFEDVEPYIPPDCIAMRTDSTWFDVNIATPLQTDDAPF
jgi:hypothetical protein